jgi:hypothetical protein
MDQTKGVMMFNKGTKMLINALVALYSLRKHYSGNITFYIEDPMPVEFENSLKYFDCNIIRNETRNDLRTLVIKSLLLENPPYDYTLWIDLDTVTIGKVDEMFDYLTQQDVDICIPSFCDWVSTGSHISKRIQGFSGIMEEKYIKEALNKHPAINTGVLSFKKSEKWSNFMRSVNAVAIKGSEQRKFIPDEISMQIHLSSIGEWGLKYYLAPTNFNVSPLHDHGLSKDPRICHFHGSKSCLDVPLCDYFKKELREMMDSNIANINLFLQYADKRLKQYLDKKDMKTTLPSYQNSDVTIVTACDPFYVEELALVFPNWIKYKQVDRHPIIVFYNGMEENDPRLDFLRLPNVRLIPWSKEKDLDNVTNHREEMLSAFVLGSAKYVQTDYWIKIDADSFATNDHALYDPEFKNYAFVGPRWGYSKVDLIKQLDDWSKTHWKRKLRNAKPMINDGKIEGSRFYHNVKRTISFVQFHKTKFSRFCVKLLKERRLPAPSHDTFYYYIVQRFNPAAMATRNYKKNYGFNQGRGRLGPDHIRKCIEEVDRINEAKANQSSSSSSSQ